MPDSPLTAWANVLVNYCTEVQPGDVVAISGGTAAEPLLRQIARAVVDRGAHPVVLPSLSDLHGYLLSQANDDQLAYVSPVERFIRQEADVLISVSAATNTRALADVDPARQAIWTRARSDLRQSFMQRSAMGAMRWCGTLYPTAAYAQDANMATDTFAAFFFAACKLHEADPAAAWRAVHREQATLIERLADADKIQITGTETDLRLSVAGRTWINSDGHRNFPSGEIFTGPVEDSATGQIRFSYPAIVNGREIAGVRLRFDAGLVVDASATQNEAFLLAMLDTDPGARRLGEFAFGTNRDVTRFTKNILLDEKIGGTLHLALGAGYPDTGSQNRSAIHWDLICDLRAEAGGGLVEVDGKPFLRDGAFVS